MVAINSHGVLVKARPSQIEDVGCIQEPNTRKCLVIGNRIPDRTDYRIEPNTIIKLVIGGMGGVVPDTDIPSLIGLIIRLDNLLLQYDGFIDIFLMISTFIMF